MGNAIVGGVTILMVIFLLVERFVEKQPSRWR